MDKRDVIAFFDRLAPQWDQDQEPRDRILNRILDQAGVQQGQYVLDVACGTGILFPFYLQRQVAEVTGVDIAPEMARLAREKNASESRVRVLCGDVEELVPDRDYDLIVVHNALPHFPDPARLIRTLAGMLQPGGRLTVAHSLSREQINAHHQGAAQAVSLGLMSAQELAELFAPYFNVDVVLSDQEMYQVCGTRK